MVNPNSRIAELIGRHLNGTLTEQEGVELTTWMAASDENRRFFERYHDEVYVQGELDKHYYYDVQTGWEKLVVRADLPRVGRVVKLRRFLSVAAAVLLLAVFTWIFIVPKTSTTNKETPADVAYKNDVQPGGDRATLQLADGRIIVLDSSGNGALVQQGSTQVTKTGEGSLKYEAGKHPLAVSYNTLSTPKGGQFSVQLPDGSTVWLNAASSVRYPTAFVGAERRVDITGEAFFDVAKNTRQPFRVHFKNKKGEESMVEVVGTSFNLNAYLDEEVVRTTLLEGKVKVVNKMEKMITPGQQAQIDENGQIKVADDINTDEIVAWKEGYFHFENKTIEEILRIASRWYDINVRYEIKPIEGYRVKVPRAVPVSKLLQYLEAAGGVHFGIDGKTVVVKQ